MKKRIALFIIGMLCLFSTIIVWEGASSFTFFGGLIICSIALMLMFREQNKNEAEYSPVYPILTLGDKQPPARRNKKKIDWKKIFYKFLPAIFIIILLVFLFFFFIQPTIKPGTSIFMPAAGVGILVVIMFGLCYKRPIKN
ncbi:hypothetical protein KAJ89_00920 [Candidatus Parcubacteria bacterium]|nr:hypothetical protein [Candidatus Parcubacteria bacterium]